MSKRPPPPEMVCMIAALVFKKDHAGVDINVMEAVDVAMKIAAEVKKRIPDDAL